MKVMLRLTGKCDPQPENLQVFPGDALQIQRGVLTDQVSALL